YLGQSLRDQGGAGTDVGAVVGVLVLEPVHRLLPGDAARRARIRQVGTAKVAAGADVHHAVRADMRQLHPGGDRLRPSAAVLQRGDVQHGRRVRAHVEPHYVAELVPGVRKAEGRVRRRSIVEGPDLHQARGRADSAGAGADLVEHRAGHRVQHVELTAPASRAYVVQADTPHAHPFAGHGSFAV